MSDRFGRMKSTLAHTACQTKPQPTVQMSESVPDAIRSLRPFGLVPISVQSAVRSAAPALWHFAQGPRPAAREFSPKKPSLLQKPETPHRNSRSPSAPTPDRRMPFHVPGSVGLQSTTPQDERRTPPSTLFG